MTLPGGDETVSRWLQNAMGMSQCLGKDRSRCIAGCIEVSVGRTRMWHSLLLVRIATRQALQMLGERVNKSHTPSKAARERERERERDSGVALARRGAGVFSSPSKRRASKQAREREAGREGV